MKKIFVMVLMISMAAGSWAEMSAGGGNSPLSLHGIRIVAGDIPQPATYQTVESQQAVDNLPIMTDWFKRFDALSRRDKTDLGAAENSTYHLYAYHFGTLSGRPVLVTAGVHGSETKTVAAAYWLARCVETSSSPVYKWIKNNVHLIVVPYCNPEGYLINTRKNLNAINPVDINRNFSWRFSAGVPADVDYGGVSAESEAETLLIKSLINPGSGMKPQLVIDCHNTGAVTSRKISLNAPDYQLPQNRNRDFDIIDAANLLVKSIDPLAWVDDSNYTGINGLRYASSVGTITNYAASIGATAYTMEVDDRAWIDDSKVASGLMTRCYVAVMTTAIYYNMSSQQPKAQDYGPAYFDYIASPGAGTPVPTTCNAIATASVFGITATTTTANGQYTRTFIANHNYITGGDYDAIAVEVPSTVIVEFFANVRPVTAISEFTSVLYLKDAAGAEVGSFKGATRQYIYQTPTTRYSAWPTMRHIYERIPAGLYYPEAAIWHTTIGTGTGLVVNRAIITVQVIPAYKYQPSYRQD